MLKRFYSIIILFCLMPSLVLGFDSKQTHPTLTEEAIDNTVDFENFLIESLGIKEGVKKSLNNGGDTKSITEWFKIGSEEEDDPMCRASSHFHDPLKQWSESYLTDPIWIVDKYCALTSPFREKYSNISWATGYSDTNSTPMPPEVNGMTASPEANGRNWFMARDWYYQALVETDPQEREKSFAETFRTLGYVLHLLEDMAVPAHTRNDFSQGHSQLVGCPSGRDCDFFGLDWIGNPFEGYVRDHFDEIDAAITGIKKPFTGEKKLTNFWDTTDSGTLPSDGTNIGLAEYSNGNFLSHATAFTKYEYPKQRDGTVNKPLPIDDPFHPGTTVQREYWVKEATSNTEQYRLTGVDYHTFVLEYLHIDGIKDFETLPPMDKYVFLDYAKLLVPRVIGYSAGLIDYFFRGTIDVALPEGADVFQVNSDSTAYSQVTMNAVNSMPLDPVDPEKSEKMDNGTVELSVGYKMPTKPAFETYPAPPPVEEVFLDPVQSTLNKIGRNPQPPLVFDLGNESIPVNAKDVRLQIVYRGQLGQVVNGIFAGEQDGIATGGINVMTEDPVEVTVPDSGYYALVAGDQDQAKDFSGELKLQARNVTPGNLQMNNGSIFLDVKYRLPVSGDSFVDDPKMAVEDVYTSFSVEESGNLVEIPRDTPIELSFDLSNNPIPTNAVDLVIQVRFEDMSGITFTGLKDISEPSPIDVFNTGNVVCIDQQWLEAGSIDAIKLVDINGDGIVGKDEHDIYPHKFNSIYWLFFPTAAPEVATADLHDFEIGESSKHQERIRLGYILTEYDTYYNLSRSKYNLETMVSEVDHLQAMPPLKFSGKGFKNQVEFDARLDCLADLSDIDSSCIKRRTSFLFPLWGKNTWYSNFIVNPEKSDPPCSYFELPQ